MSYNPFDGLFEDPEAWIADENDPYAYPDWERTLVEPNPEELAEMDSAAAELERTAAEPQEGNVSVGVMFIGLRESEEGGEEFFMESGTIPLTPDPDAVSLSPEPNPDPAIVQANVFQRNMRIAILANQRKNRTELENHLTTLRKALAERELAAVMNWDKKGGPDGKGAPVDPEKPWNDGSNDDKRAAVNRQLFAQQYEEIEAVNQLLLQIEEKIHYVDTDLKILNNNNEYYRWWMDYQLLLNK